MTNDRNESQSPSCEDPSCEDPSCEDHEANLSAYALGELDVLSDDERAGLEAHLKSCERCREEEMLLRRTIEAVAQASATLEAVTLDEVTLDEVTRGEETLDEATRLETDRRDVVLNQAAEAVVTESQEAVTSQEAVKAAAIRTSGSGTDGRPASQRVSSRAVLLRRMSWAAAAAVIVACMFPFLRDWFGPPLDERRSAATSVALLAPELKEESNDRGRRASSFVRSLGELDRDGDVDLLATSFSGERLNRTSAGTAPQSLEELSITAEAPARVLDVNAESMRAQPSSSSIAAKDSATIASTPLTTYRLPRPEAIRPEALAQLTGVFDLSRTEVGAVEDERRDEAAIFAWMTNSTKSNVPTAEGDVQLSDKTLKAGLGTTTEGVEVSMLGRQPTTAGVELSRVYSVNVSVPGTDGIINKVDDRILLSGGGSDGRFVGGEPSVEILLPPNLTSETALGLGVKDAVRSRLSVLREQIAESAPPARYVAGRSSSAAKETDRELSLSISAEQANRGLGVGGGAAGARGERAGKPASRGVGASLDGEEFLALKFDFMAPTRTEARGRSKDLTRVNRPSTRLSVGGALLQRRRVELEAIPAGAEASSDSSVATAPLALDNLSVVHLSDGGVVASNETLVRQRQRGQGRDSFGRQRQDLERLQRQLGEVRLREAESLTKLSEKQRLEEESKRNKSTDYFYREAAKAEKAESEKARKAEPDKKKLAELAKRFVVAAAVEEKAPLVLDRLEGTPWSRSTRPVIDPQKLVEEYCQRLAPRPGETPEMMFFRYWGTNPFVETNVDNQSTFAVDVDTASYTLTRKYLTDRGVLPPREAIRTEEFVNYFNYEYAPPPEGQTFAVHTEMAASPFGHEPEYQLLKIGVKGREVTKEKRQRCALVFVVDTSGSMARETRLELVKDGLRLLVREVDEGDTIGIVAFDRTARTILEPTPADQKEKILDAINTLQPRRNTNVDSGLTMGYQMAAGSFIDGGTNRVLLLSDGVANTGVTDVAGMLANVKTQRQKGIFLTCIGVGMGNHNDTLLEQLADRGDGQCVYVDRLEEAHKVFVENLVGTLETIARDVKIQVEFDKEKVLRYRLLGYENRAVADSAFRDDTVDAGEVGAGHEISAIYELKCAPGAEGRIATVRVRHLKVDSREPVELEHVVDTSSRRGTFADASPRFQLSALAGEFAEILRGSYWARGSDPARVAAMTQDLLGDGGMKLGADPEVVELAALMFRAAPLIEARRKSEGDLAQVVDALKENTHLRRRVETLRLEESEENTRYLRDLQHQNEELRRRLERILDRRFSGGQ